MPFVECSEPHDSEVFARTDLTGDMFPGNDTLETELATFCRGDVFTQFIGIAVRRLDVRHERLLPERVELGERRPRTAVHRVGSGSAQVTGTLAGING